MCAGRVEPTRGMGEAVHGARPLCSHRADVGVARTAQRASHLHHSCPESGYKQLKPSDCPGHPGPGQHPLWPKAASYSGYRAQREPVLQFIHVISCL